MSREGDARGWLPRRRTLTSPAESVGGALHVRWVSFTTAAGTLPALSSVPTVSLASAVTLWPLVQPALTKASCSMAATSLPTTPGALKPLVHSSSVPELRLCWA